MGSTIAVPGRKKKMITWLDNNPKILKWGSECITVPYQMTHYEKNGDINLKNHCYYPDFYYEMMGGDGLLRKVIAEVKPMKEYLLVQQLNENSMSIPDKATMKKLKSFEYDLKMSQKNRDKWSAMIRFCEKRGWEFIIITEEHLKKFKL